MIKIPRRSDVNPSRVPNKPPKLYELRDGSFTTQNPHETNLKKLKRDDPKTYAALKKALRNVEDLDDRLQSNSALKS